MSALASDAGVELTPDPSRVVARLLLPSGAPGAGSRVSAVLDRVLRMPDDELAAQARYVREHFADRHHGLHDILATHASAVGPDLAPGLTQDATVVVGAAFTAEHTVEGAALCNPSAVPHPDQTGLRAGQLRVLLSLRSVGESHLSTVQLGEAVIGPGATWTFTERARPLRPAAVTATAWDREHLVRVLHHEGVPEELVLALALVLPDTVDAAAVGSALDALRPDLAQTAEVDRQVDAVRAVAVSTYRAVFDADSPISSRVLVPSAPEERQGIEDVRLTRTEDDGVVSYRGTYTAYDGRGIASRALTTTDFREITVHRLTGPPARTKGMALFPRRVGGEHLALSRSDGESIGLTRSSDGLDWSAQEHVHGPQDGWDVVQGGNCGPPLETPHGWLVLTHGVGPMRVYRIGAILLDLDDPTRVLRVLDEPLLSPEPGADDGYVPHVVYSCGGLLHEGRLWIPYGVCDARVRVASVEVDALLEAMRPV